MALQSSDKKPLFPPKSPLHATKSVELCSIASKPAISNGKVCSSDTVTSETKQQASEVIGKMVFQQICFKNNKTKMLWPPKLSECSIIEPEAETMPLDPPEIYVTPKSSNISQSLPLKKAVSLPVSPKKNDFHLPKPVVRVVPLKVDQTCPVAKSDSECPQVTSNGFIPLKPLPLLPPKPDGSQSSSFEKLDALATSETLDVCLIPKKSLPPTPRKPEVTQPLKMEQLDVSVTSLTLDSPQLCPLDNPICAPMTLNSTPMCPPDEPSILSSLCPIEPIARPLTKPLPSVPLKSHNTMSCQEKHDQGLSVKPLPQPPPESSGATLLVAENQLAKSDSPMGSRKPLPATPPKPDSTGDSSPPVATTDSESSLLCPLNNDITTGPVKTPKVPPKFPGSSSGYDGSSEAESLSSESRSNSSQGSHEMGHVKNKNGFRNSLRLVRIEPTMSSHGSRSNGHAKLSALNENGEGSFPCSISPSTLHSMELVFSFTDADILERLSSAWPVKCTYVVKEVIMTERAYVQALADIIEGYLTRLYSYVLETGESPNFIRTVFGNIVKIHQIHIALLEAMQSASTKPAEFARVFMDCDFLTQYTIYCTNYSKGNSLLEKVLSSESDMKHFIVECQRDLNHTLPLTSYLIKPVQRILKYPLLLDDLFRKFGSTDSRASHLLKRALEKMSSAAVEINTAFNHPAKGHKHDAREIVQKRLHQVRELQKSRSIDCHRSSTSDHSHSSGSSSLPRGYGRSALFPVPASNSLERLGHLDDKMGAWTQQSPIEACVLRRESGTKPAVRDLKKFYDRLTEKSQEEMRQRSISSSRAVRASSVEESFVTVSRPSVSRTGSVGNLLKLGKKSSDASDHKPESKSIMKWFARSRKHKNRHS